MNHQNKQPNPIDSTETELDGYRGLYLERAGESAAELVNVLMAEPERPLNPQDKEAAYEFEHQLAELKLSDGTSVETFIRLVRHEDQVAPLVFPEYIVNGSVDMSGFNAPELKTHQAVYEWFARAVDEKALSLEELRSAAKQTVDAYKRRTVLALTEGVPPSSDEEAATPIVISPEEVVVSGKRASELRQVLLGLRQDCNEHAQPLEGAKRAIVDVYLGRTNGIIAELVPVTHRLVEQAEIIGDEDTARAAWEVIPRHLRAAFNGEQTERQLMRRLDYLRNGMGLDAEGRATAVTLALEHAVRPETYVEGAVFTPEQTEVLKNSYLEPVEVQSLFERIIARAGLLSSEDPATWTKERRIRAADGLFQVVIDPGRTSYAVDGTSGVFKVPSEKSSLYNVIAVGGAHELQHVSQSQSDEEVGKTLRIGVLKGRRPTMLREGGANAIQRKTELALFGRAKPVAVTYGRAFQVLENGGGVFAATKAFYDQKRQAIGGIKPEAAAKEAADRVLRLVRYGGSNSLSLAYGEEGILMDELEGCSLDVQARATAITGLDLVDQVRLHKYGLLPEVPASIDWSAFVLEEMGELLQEKLKTDP